MKQQFKLFDPKRDSQSLLPNLPGNYLIILRLNSRLPEIATTPKMKTIEIQEETYCIIYTGISQISIKKRDYRQHFAGNNAGKSTLRKSLGSLMGFAKIPRDKNKPNNGKTKFNKQDENSLTLWMANNLLLLYCIGNTSEDIKHWETKLINEYNPPLNIQNNKNLINKEYRDKLKELRKE